MSAFMIVGGVVLALVVGAWMKLAPTRDERRRAALRQAAIASGLQVRWMPASESATLAVAAGHVWYVLSAPDQGRTAWSSVRHEGAWQGGRATAPLLAAAPAGVAAVRVAPPEVAVAWDEREGEAVAEIIRLLESLAATSGA